VNLGLTFAVDNYPAVIFRGVLRDLLAGELHGLLVVAIAIHGGEVYTFKLCNKKVRCSSPNTLSLCCIVPVYLYNDSTGRYRSVTGNNQEM
jgi:hypothetical protein